MFCATAPWSSNLNYLLLALVALFAKSAVRFLLAVLQQSYLVDHVGHSRT